MHLTRREALQLLLGAPLAATACRKPSHRFSGEIRGAGVEVGHRLRTPLQDATFERAVGVERHVKIAIVGAGPSGLNAAWRCQRLGEQDYVLFDLEQKAGGTALFGTDGVSHYPWGAHYVPMPSPQNRALTELLREMNVIERGRHGHFEPKEEFRVRELEERLFIDGAWRPGLYPEHGAQPEDYAELQRFQREVARWVAFRDARGRRAFAVPVSRCSDAAELKALDRISAKAWLDARGFRSRRLLWFIEYACRDDYGLTLEQTSAWAMLFYFAARADENGRDSAPFLTWPEGNGRLVKHLSQAIGPRLRTGKLVTDVVVQEDRVQLAIFDVEHSRLERWTAEHAILAVPKFLLPRIFRPFREQPPAHLEPFSYGAWMVANLHLTRRPEGAGVAWDNVIYDSQSLGYVVATHQRFQDFGPTIWTYYQPLTDPDPKRARAQLLALDHQDTCDAIVADLGRAHSDLASTLERIDLFRWGHAMVRPTPGVIWGGAREQASRPYGRVHFAHSDLSGVALFEEAQDWGVRAAEAVLRQQGRTFEPLVQA